MTKKPSWFVSDVHCTSAPQIYREGKDKERVFDLLTLERKRIESFEQQACWQSAQGPDDLQVGAGAGCTCGWVGDAGRGWWAVAGTEECSRQQGWAGWVGAFNPAGLVALVSTCSRCQLQAGRATCRSWHLHNRQVAVPAACPVQRKLLSASFLRNTDRTDGNARSSRSRECVPGACCVPGTCVGLGLQMAHPPNMGARTEDAEAAAEMVPCTLLVECSGASGAGHAVDAAPA